MHESMCLLPCFCHLSPRLLCLPSHRIHIGVLLLRRSLLRGGHREGGRARGRLLMRSWPLAYEAGDLTDTILLLLLLPPWSQDPAAARTLVWTRTVAG